MMNDFTLTKRISERDDQSDLEMRSSTEKYTIGTVEDEYAGRIVACVNACAGVSDDELVMIGRMFDMKRKQAELRDLFNVGETPTADDIGLYLQYSLGVEADVTNIRQIVRPDGGVYPVSPIAFDFTATMNTSPLAAMLNARLP